MTPEQVRAEAARIAEMEREQAGGVDIPLGVGGVKDAVIQFTEVNDYTTFAAEYSLVGGDIIVHFFPPAEQYELLPDGKRRARMQYLNWWRTGFAQVLDRAAQDYFRATAPILSAEYIPEMTSWWLRAGGFARRLDPAGFTERFFAHLDQQIEAAVGSTGAAG